MTSPTCHSSNHRPVIYLLQFATTEAPWISRCCNDPGADHLTRAAYIDRCSHDRYTPHKREGLPFAAAIPCAGWLFSLDAPPFGEDAFMTKSEQSYVNMPDSE